MSGNTNVGEVPIKIAEAINRIGTQIGVRLEIPNDETAHAALELYIAQQIKRAAESRAEAAREEFVKLITAPVHRGTHIVHDSAYATVIADMRASPRRFVEAKLVSAIVKRFNITIEDAQALIDSAKQTSNSLVMQLTPALK